MQLRDYQQSTIEHLLASTYERECISLPTGGGKTLIFSAFANAQAEQGRKTLIVVNRVELLKQTANTLLSVYGILAGQIDAKSKQVGLFKVYVAMVETLHRRAKHIEYLTKVCDTIIIDECHIGSFNKLLSHGWKRVLGFSATPTYVKKGDCLANYYWNLYEPTNVAKLIKDGYLCPPEYYVPAEALLSDRAELTLNKSRTDYDEGQMGKVFSRPKFVNVLCQYVEKLANGKRAIIYNASIEHSQNVTTALRTMGYNAWHVDGNTPEAERGAILKRLHEESDCIVSNVNILTFGFDCPEVEVIFVNRLTMSIALYHQMCGRGARLSTKIPKTRFVIADMFANYQAHGMWNHEVNWQSLFLKSKSETTGIAPMKSCPKCDRLLPIQASSCVECGYIFPEKESQEVEEIDPRLVRLETAKEVLPSLVKRVQDVGQSKYRSLHLIKERIYNENKGVSLQSLQETMLDCLPLWCKQTDTKHNRWHKDFAVQIMKEHFELKQN